MVRQKIARLERTAQSIGAARLSRPTIYRVLASD
jgi:hypothetical protein